MQNNWKYTRSIVSLFLAMGVLACDPAIDDDIDLGPLPEAPEFTVEFIPGDSNRVVVRDLTENTFDRLWVFKGGDPQTSKRASDTVFYFRAGDYKITLHIAAIGGSGTASSTKTVTILKDVEIACDDKLGLLTGACGPDGKCWTFSPVAGAVTVGPTYGSAQWYTSPAGGLVPEQYDDSFCFTFEDRVFTYENNGATVNPWQGYIPVPYDPPVGNWTYKTGTGRNGVDQIVLPQGSFMGVWDSGNVLDVIILTEDQLVIRTPLVDQQGVPQAEGWFELSFVAR